ncbi:hypothetical protein ACOSQ3_032729 [Xanthoceras sorbifolium]
MRKLPPVKPELCLCTIWCSAASTNYPGASRIGPSWKAHLPGPHFLAKITTTTTINKGASFTYRKIC